MENPPEASREQFARTIGEKGERKHRARNKKGMNILFGMGMFGVIGWSVSIPTLLGIALGVWLDSRFATRISWTVTLMVVGITLGAAIAWYWIRTETQSEEPRGPHS